MQDGGDKVEPIVYIPHLKKTIQLNANLTFGAAALWAFLGRTDSLPFVLALGALLLLGAYHLFVSYRFRTFLVLDWNGIHVMHAKEGELLLVSWAQIKLCKFYPGVYDSPSVCVLFQSAAYSIHGTPLCISNGPIDIKREGKRILCDRSLLNLSRSKINIDTINNLEVFGITATAEQFKCISEWHQHSSAEGTTPPEAEA